MIKIFISTLLIFSSNVYAAVPAKDSSVGKVLEGAFSNYGSCYINFLAWGSDIPDEDKYCNIGNGLIVTSAVTGFASGLIVGSLLGPIKAIPIAIGVATGAVVADLSITFAAASAIANEAHVCRITPDSDDIQPGAYTNEQGVEKVQI